MTVGSLSLAITSHLTLIAAAGGSDVLGETVSHGQKQPVGAAPQAL
jgi:hypothetical protein